MADAGARGLGLRGAVTKGRVGDCTKERVARLTRARLNMRHWCQQQRRKVVHERSVRSSEDMRQAKQTVYAAKVSGLIKQPWSLKGWQDLMRVLMAK